MARRAIAVGAAVILSVLVVLALFVHLSRRGDLLEDVLALPPTGDQTVVKLTRARTTYPLSRTPVKLPGDVALRVSARDAAASDTSLVVRVLGPNRKVLATCRFARGTFVDTNVLRCPVLDLSLVRRARITVSPVTEGFGVVGSRLGVGSLLTPRAHSLVGRLRTVLGRIGAKHPAPFTGWIVPVGTVLWLSGLLLCGLWIARSPRDDG
ncbi:MAG: hypothetical protein QOE87_4508 [Gaiellales bacterium]|nr:hypothetical protein [Gaiellales bacterium]